MKTKTLFGAVAVALLVVMPTTASAANFAVWLDGNTTPDGGGSGIVTSLRNTFGFDSVTLVSTTDLENPTFLRRGSFDAVVISRFDSGGTALSFLAAANVAAYVGPANSPTQGGVAVFTNNAADNFFGATTGDPFDVNLNTLFINAATYAASSRHGYIGEFNGAVSAMTSNTDGFAPIGLLTGVASATIGVSTPDGHFHFLVGLGATGDLVTGVTFPFTDADTRTFRTNVTGALSTNIVSIYGDANLPALLANQGAIPPPPVPEPSAYVLMLAGLGVVGFAVRRRQRHATVA